METMFSSKTKTVLIGPEHPFVMIGERINPTGRKALAREMAAFDFTRVEADAIAQVEAGAQMLDVNAGIPMADEPKILAEAIQRVQAITDVPLAIDSSIVEALAAGLAVYEGKPLVNSVTGEEERLEAVLPMVKQYNAAVIAISNDESGISEDPDVRFEVAKRIVERAQDYGIPKEDVVIDPLAMPIGAVRTAGSSLFRIVRRCQEELGVNTVCGASNISFGIPGRAMMNAAFIAMAMSAGMPCAITNPLETEIRMMVLAGDALLGNDENCVNWLAANRALEQGTKQAQASFEQDERAARRAARRARREGRS